MTNSMLAGQSSVAARIQAPIAVPPPGFRTRSESIACLRAWRSAMAKPLRGKTGTRYWFPATTAKRTSSRMCSMAAAVALRASLIFFPVIEPETSTMITSAAAAPATGTWPAPGRSR